MPTTRLIAFYGYKGCGKSEAAKQLTDFYGFTMHSFATPMKQMLQAIGLTEAQLWGDQREVPSELLGGKTPRWAMQSLGTEWGRHRIDDNIWVRAWQEGLPTERHKRRWVVDDLRFPNEAAAIKILGGHIVKIERPGLAFDTTHESEKYVDDEDAIPPDEIIVNDGTLDAFKTNVALMQARMMNKWRGR